MDLVTSLAFGLGLIGTIGNILPLYYSSSSQGLLPALVSSFSDLDRTQDALGSSISGPGSWISDFQEYDFIVGICKFN